MLGKECHDLHRERQISIQTSPTDLIPCLLSLVVRVPIHQHEDMIHLCWPHLEVAQSNLPVGHHCSSGATTVFSMLLLYNPRNAKELDRSNLQACLQPLHGSYFGAEHVLIYRMLVESKLTMIDMSVTIDSISFGWCAHSNEA